MMDFGIRLYGEKGFHVYRTGNRRVNVVVSHNGDYAIDFLEDGVFHPKEGYFTKVNLFGEAHLVESQIIEFLYSVHITKTKGVLNVPLSV